MPRTGLVLALVAVILLADGRVYTAEAGGTRELRVETINGESRVTIRDSLRGDQPLAYKLGIGPGQHVIAWLESDNAGSHFDLIAPGKIDEPFFNGSTGGNRFEGDLPEAGAYTVRVYLAKDAASRNETADFTITVHMTAASTWP
jgi:hypothetical protein